MSKVDEYRLILRATRDWVPFLLAESRLPGPRANLELAQAVAEEGTEDQFRLLLAFGPDQAPANTPAEFLPVCGILGLGRLLAEGRADMFPILRQHAVDPRWRSREAVAMALQRMGDVDMQVLLGEMASWSQGSPLEQRAAAAALCEPRLLGRAPHVRQVLRLLQAITASVAAAGERRADEFQALRKGLAYCWSVAVAALPDEGREAMEAWFDSDDPDVRWIMKQNLQKKRLARLDPGWTARSLARLGG